MAKAKKLPSGSWRCLVYSHTEKVRDAKTGEWKNKRVYESFTSDDPSPKGRREAELAAAQFQMEKSQAPKKKKQEYGNMTLTEAIDKYVESRELLGRSPTTIQDYRCIQKNGFQDLLDTRLSDIDEGILQEAICLEAKRPSNGRQKLKKPISAKRLKNEWGLLSAVLHKYRPGINYDMIELPKAALRTVELPPARKILDIIQGTDIELPVLLAMWLSFSMSEVRGLTKSKSVSGNYITIREVVVDVGNGPVRNITFHDLRHLNASVMALLRIPDKYAQERGGWKSDNVMKKIYMQTFPEEREKVDDMIDHYFEDIMQHEIQHEIKKAQ